METQTLLRGERNYTGGRMVISLEVREDFVSLWANHFNESYLYILNRGSKKLWTGYFKGQKRLGKISEPGSAEYHCNLTSMKTYLADLFLLKPEDPQVLKIIKELGGYENILRRVSRLLVND